MKKWLTKAQEEFITSGLAIVVSSANDRLAPSSCNAMACDLNRNESVIRIFLPKNQVGQLLDDVQKHGILAVAFSDPLNHQTIQIKGIDARISDKHKDDINVLSEARKRFDDKLISLGISQIYTNALFDFNIDDIAVISFSPDALFEQSPGPEAGKVLEFQA
jgi:hypothetical protein